MDLKDLGTASQYINNQLLSRGLLRHGKTINFTRPHADKSDNDETMSRIMVLIDDLILRRDRDASQRENLITSIQSLRADSQRLSTEVERLKEGKTEVARKLAIAEADKSSCENKLKFKEEKERALQSEVKRLKNAVSQARTKCAMECRKREVTIERLKKTVSESRRVRGCNKESSTHEIETMTGMGATQATTTSKSVDAENYDLYSESKQFLAELAKGLSEDNEHLAGLLQRTLDTLKALLGWDRPREITSLTVETGVESLSGELEFVIEHIRTLLTNPSFVPLEEVEVREEEILRLRKGWEDMEQRWKDAVSMMGSWRKRMMDDNGTVNPGELDPGASFNSSSSITHKPSPHKLSTVREDEEESDMEANFEVKDETKMLDAISEPEVNKDDLGSNFSFFEGEFLDEMCDEKSEPGSEDFEEREANFNSVSPVLFAIPHENFLSETKENRSPTRIFPAPQSKSSKENRFSPKKSDIRSNLKDGASHSKLGLPPLSQIPSHQTNASDDNTDASGSPAASHTSKKRILKSASKMTAKFASNDRASTLRAKTSVRKTSASPNRSNHLKSLQRTELKCQVHQVQSTYITKQAPQGASYKPSSMATPKLKLGPDHRLPQPCGSFPQPCGSFPQQSPLTVTSIAAKLTASEHDTNAARIRAKLRAARSSKNLASPAKNHPVTGTKQPATKFSDESSVSEINSTCHQKDGHDEDKPDLKAENEVSSITEERSRKRKDRSPVRESSLKLIRGVR
ncbi:hypothetical protein K3495_g8164 [Podosphaera aphanis]|nr:hypothetical protein K3495_g8164 [Podosphaera aphanis]